MTEYGIFTDEGCIDAGMSQVEAEKERAELIAEGAEPDELTVKAMCSYHDGQADGDCDECAHELASDCDDETDTDEEM